MVTCPSSSSSSSVNVGTFLNGSPDLSENLVDMFLGLNGLGVFSFFLFQPFMAEIGGALQKQTLTIFTVTVIHVARSDKFLL